MSYGGRTLPHVYDQVFHNQCCEAAIHNVETLGDAVLFHALWDGTWYLVEAGIYDGEMSGTYRYTAPEGWSFRYPMHWDRLDEESGFVQNTATGKAVTFASQPTTQAELERWLESEIARKLAATEAGQHPGRAAVQHAAGPRDHVSLRHPVAPGSVRNLAAHNRLFRRAAPLRILRRHSAVGRGRVRGYRHLFSPGWQVESGAQL